MFVKGSSSRALIQVSSGNKDNTLQVNKNILDKIPKKDNLILNNEKRLKISKNIFNLINSKSQKNRDYILRKNFSQGDIYFN